MGTTFELALGGVVPRTVAEVVRDRFGEVTIRQGSGRAVLVGRIADQAAIRALLDLLWDTGCEVTLLRIATDPPGTP